jgi:hypothetical protein
MLFISVLALLSCSDMLSFSSGHGSYLAPLEGMNNHDKYSDEYLVTFHENYTLEQHFDTIGENLLSLPEFRRYGYGYGAIMNNKTRDERVRRDPGVRMVETEGPGYAVEPYDMVVIESQELSNNRTSKQEV